MTNYFESIFVQAWYPMTVCTNSNEQKRLIKAAFAETCDSLETLDFKLHDFGFRGATSVEAAGIGGCAHLCNFKGTDNIAAILTAKKYYPGKEVMPGMSIPASEHSTMTTWGRDHEKEAVEHILDNFKTGLVSVVSDSYNLWHFIDQILGKDLKDKILARDGTLVVRPDSGDPLATLLEVLDKLGQAFPPSKNGKGFKLLPDQVRVIQGDGISYETMECILKALKVAGWSADNVTFGSGGALLQKLDRDTQKCAFKCCLAEINGKLVRIILFLVIKVYYTPNRLLLYG